MSSDNSQMKSEWVTPVLYDLSAARTAQIFPTSEKAKSNREATIIISVGNVRILKSHS